VKSFNFSKNFVKGLVGCCPRGQLPASHEVAPPMPCNSEGLHLNVSGLCDSEAIEFRQPNLAQKPNWKTKIEPMFVSPTIAKPLLAVVFCQDAVS
jgi:hypothetical protein